MSEHHDLAAGLRRGVRCGLPLALALWAALIALGGWLLLG